MFSRWIVMNITSAPGTLHCRKTRIPCGDKLVICGQYSPFFLLLETFQNFFTSAPHHNLSYIFGTLRRNRQSSISFVKTSCFCDVVVSVLATGPPGSHPAKGMDF
jgi:hypothetical protein